MKKNLKKILALLVLANITVAISAPQILDRIIAIVDEDVVLESELVRRSNTILRKIKERKQALPSIKTLRKQVLERLIIESLKLQTAKRMGVRIGDRELSATLEKIAQGEKLSLSQYKTKVEKSGESWTLFREDVRKEIKVSRVTNGMVQRRIQVSEKEVDNLVEQINKEGDIQTQYHLGHILIALSENASPELIENKRKKAETIIKYLREGANFEEVAITHSDGQNSLEGGDMGWRSISQLPTLFASVVKNLSANEVSEPLRSASGLHILFLKEKKGGFEAQVVVQTHVRHILVSPSAITSDKQALDKINLTRDRILAGEKFEDLAIEISDDKSNASQGGDMSWVDPGVFVAEFSKAMNALSINELSQPVKTQFGWHLIEVLARRDQDQTEEKKRTRAYRILSNRKFEEESLSWVNELKHKAHIKTYEAD